MERKWCGGRGWSGAEPKSPPKPAVWCTPVLSTAWEGMWRREDHGIETSVGHRVGPCSRKQKEKQSKRGWLELAAKPRDVSSVPRPLLVKGELSTCALAMLCMCTHRE